MVGEGPFGATNLYVPFRLIRSIDPHELYLSVSKATLEAQYTEPPKITTVSETRVVFGPQGAMTTQTSQVQMVQSGYDGTQMTVSSVDVEAIAQRLAIGMTVYDAEGVRLGEITQYDTTRGLLVVESGVFKPRVLFVPFGAIQSVDRETPDGVLERAKGCRRQGACDAPGGCLVSPTGDERLTRPEPDRVNATAPNLSNVVQIVYTTNHRQTSDNHSDTKEKDHEAPVRAIGRSVEARQAGGRRQRRRANRGAHGGPDPH